MSPSRYADFLVRFSLVHRIMLLSLPPVGAVALYIFCHELLWSSQSSLSSQISHFLLNILVIAMIFPIVSVLYMIKALHTDKGKVIYIPKSSDHRQFLGFAFQGRAYEYNGIPFGLSLSRSQNAWMLHFSSVAEGHLTMFNYLND